MPMVIPLATRAIAIRLFHRHRPGGGGGIGTVGFCIVIVIVHHHAPPPPEERRGRGCAGNKQATQTQLPTPNSQPAPSHTQQRPPPPHSPPPPPPSGPRRPRAWGESWGVGVGSRALRPARYRPHGTGAFCTLHTTHYTPRTPPEYHT